MRARHHLLLMTIGTFPEEENTFTLVTILMCVLPLGLVITSLLEWGLFLLYNRMLHPWKEILKNDLSHEKKKDPVQKSSFSVSNYLVLSQSRENILSGANEWQWSEPEGVNSPVSEKTVGMDEVSFNGKNQRKTLGKVNSENVGKDDSFPSIEIVDIEENVSKIVVNETDESEEVHAYSETEVLAEANEDIEIKTNETTGTEQSLEMEMEGTLVVVGPSETNHIK